MKETNESFFSEMVRFALITLAIVLPIRFFIAEPFIVNGASMDPTFKTGDYLIIDQISYRFNEPERGEVVVFRFPQDPKKYFIKRIVGLPGETVEISGNTTKIKNHQNLDGFIIDESYITHMESGNGTFNLGVDEYFVMGDNRGASSDSRVWGALPKENIVGKAFVRLFPPKTIGILPGDHSEN